MPLDLEFVPGARRLGNDPRGIAVFGDGDLRTAEKRRGRNRGPCQLLLEGVKRLRPQRNGRHQQQGKQKMDDSSHYSKKFSISLIDRPKISKKSDTGILWQEKFTG